MLEQYADTNIRTKELLISLPNWRNKKMDFCEKW